MSIIIRLQNLPWAANSVDIRRYFSGLSIPEGGVHIVGGEKGDAFIAFSTDEDARLAMERDGGKIKDMKVKLLLSSRAEMTRVIEQARNQNLALQTPSTVKAAANDSDRRKVRDRSSSPGRSRKEREKSPTSVRDRNRKLSSYSKRERSRTRSRSPSRRMDRDRDTDRRGDRTKRDDRSRYDDRNERYKTARDYSSRDLSLQDRKPDSTKGQPELSPNKSLDPRMGATPQSFDSRHLDGGGIRTGGMEFDPRQGNLPDGNLPFFDSRSQPTSVSSASSYTFPAAINIASVKLDLKSEALQPPSFPALGAFSSLFGEKQPAESRPSGNYETKRPSPTPAALAPKVGPNSPYTKGYNMSSRSDPYNSVSGNFGNCPDPTTPTYGTVQTAEKGAVPAVPHDRKNTVSNKPVYGAEPHARYEQIPEANQASRSSTAPVSADDSGPYGKRLPPKIPPATTSAMNVASTKPPRRSRFAPESAASQDDPYAANDARSAVFSSRQADKTSHSQPGIHSSNQSPREKPLSRNEALWPGQPSSSGGSIRPALLTPPQHPDEFPEDIAMDIDTQDDKGSQGTLPTNRIAGHPLRREGVLNLDNRPPLSRGFFPGSAERQKSKAFEDPPGRSREPPLLNEHRHGPLLKRNEELPPVGRERGPPLTVEVRGLPFDASENDVLELFRGIFVAPENLKLQRNSRGQPNGCAFVKFLKPRDCEEALSRSRQKSIGGALPEVRPCPLAIFENAPVSKPALRMEKVSPSSQGPRQTIGSHNEDFCVELKGLPDSCTEDDIVQFFDGLGILDIIILPCPDRRGVESAFVEFGTLEDLDAALNCSDKMIGHRYISVIMSSKKNMNMAHKKRLGETKTLFPQPASREPMQLTRRVRNKGSRIIAQDGPMYCVALNGLPKNIKNHNIADFFAEDKLVPRAIHIMLDSKKLPSGEAFAEFADLHEFEKGLQRNGKILAGSRISIDPITYQEMCDILKGPQSAPPPPLLRNPESDRPTRRPLMPMPPPREDEVLMRDRRQVDDVPPDSFGPGHRHRSDSRFSQNDRSAFEHPEPLMGARPPFNRMRGPVPPRAGTRPPRPPLFGPDGAPPRGPPRFRSSGPPRMPPPEQSDGPTDFGMPGCVVAISNLHFHAGLDELMEAFHNFPVNKDSIIRKYNEKGQATGEARIAFECHEDAVRAVEEVNQKIIFGRPIFLSLV